MKTANSLRFVGAAMLACMAIAQVPRVANSQTRLQYEYPEIYVNTYVESCTNQAVTNGFSEAIAREYCTCTIQEFQQRYTIEELVQAFEVNGLEDLVVTKVVEICATEALSQLPQ